MALAAEDVSRIERWGPVCRAFNVSFANGARGRVTEIRLRDGGVELLVESPSSPAPAVVGADIEAILPPTRRIISRGSSVAVEDDAVGLDAVGGIVRMPARHSSRIAAPPQEAA